MQRLLNENSHRPYPLPHGQWVMSQDWNDLLFAHWTVPLDILRAHIPPQLEIDCFEGEAYVGVVPFRMNNVKPRWLPAIGPLSNFLELNVRTYVTVKGRPGVYFFSLDASNSIAVFVAKVWYHLPYFRAKMTQSLDERGWLHYNSTRYGVTNESAFKASYRASEGIELSGSGSLEAFLTERYCLYTVAPDGFTYRGDIHHRQWPLQKAEAKIEINTMGKPYGFDFSGPPILHFSSHLETIEWPLQKLN